MRRVGVFLLIMVGGVMGISINETLIDCKCGKGSCINNNETCISIHGYCYQSAIINENTVIGTEYGCIGNHMATNMCYQPRHTGINIIIECCNTTFCNQDMLKFSNKIQSEISSSVGSGAPNRNILMVVLGAVSTLVIVIITGIIYKFLKSKVFKKLIGAEKNAFIPLSDKAPQFRNNLLDEISLSNTSGAGRTQFVQRTIAKQAQLIELVGKGRYGEVWKALWRGDPVAIKQFDPRDEHSWNQEVKMYETSWLRHENIVGYIGSDCKDTVSATRWWIMMEYCQHGSLHEYLQNAKYTPLQLLESIRGIYSGIEHLHSAIYGNKHNKPAIAHRDLKTRNIMVKYPTHCCIGDLGLAITSENFKDSVNKANCQVGTRRYMAPEILSGSANIANFKTFLSADMFSSSYILWEMMHRVDIDNEISGYTLPFIHEVPGDPTIEDMKDIVVGEKARPPLPDRWQKNAITRELCNIVVELWYDDPDARLTALRVKKTLTEMSLHQQDSFPPV